VLLVTLARTTPVADLTPIPALNAAPISAIGPNRIAVTRIGVALGGGDEMFIQDFNLAVAPPAPAPPIRVPILSAHIAPGPGNFSLPFTTDGDTIFVMGVGLNGTPSNGDDALYIHTVSTATTTAVVAPYLLGPPVAISSALVAAPGAGANLVFGGAVADDTLEVISLAAAWTRVSKPLNQPLNVAALASYARCGNGVAVAVAGPNAIKVFTNPVAGTNTTVTFPGNPLFASLASAGVAVLGPGANLVPGGGDDQAILIDTLGAPQSFSQAPNLPLTVLPLADADRAFALSPGGDTLFGTNDDILEVYQSRAAGALVSASRLPAAALPAGKLIANDVFVPIGPGWGVVQSPGPNGTYGNVDDALVILRY
jgi:hypothetical protein